MKRTLLVTALVLTVAAKAESPPPSCSGSPSYKLAIQVSLDGGNTWVNNSATLYMQQSRTVSIMARTLLTVTTGQTQGWSFSLQYDNSNQSYYGGSMGITAVTTSGTQTMTVQNGGPPDRNQTAIRSGYKGYTQGILVDSDLVYELAPTSNFVTSKACFSITSSATIQASYPIVLKFTHAAGNPSIRTVVTQNGLSTVPCAQNFTLTVNVNPYQTTTGGCSIGGSGLMAPGAGGDEFLDGIDGPGMMGGMGGAFSCLKRFKRGDSNDTGTVDISDAVFSLNYLFLGGTMPGCLDSADANDDGFNDISDGVYTLLFLFSGGAPLPPPGNQTCGIDPTEDGLDCAVSRSCCGCDLPPFMQLSPTTAPSFSTELMASKDVQSADFDKDGDLDAFVPHSRGGAAQPDLVYINRINEPANTIEKQSAPVNNPANDHDGMGNGLCDPQPPCEFETTYASLIIDIGGPNGAGPDTWPDIITVNGSDFMRILINQQAGPGTFPSFVDEGGRVVESGSGWIADIADPTSRIYNCQTSGLSCTAATDLLGPLTSTKPDFIETDDKQTSLDDVDAADIDGDGDLDLFLSNRDALLFGQADIQKHNFILRNNGFGKFDIFSMYQESVEIITHDSAFGDYDGDGDPDLLNANDDTNIKLWNNILGQIPMPNNPADLFVDVTGAAGLFAGQNNAHAAFVNFNNDAFPNGKPKLDIHVDGFTDPLLFYNNGDGTFSFEGPALYAYHATYADMNGDGWVDIVAARQSRGDVWLNCTNVSGEVRFSHDSDALPPGGNPPWNTTYGASVGDYDLDGDFDIIFGQGDGGGEYQNLVFLNQIVSE